MTQLPLFDDPNPLETVPFSPTRTAGLARLDHFAPRMGKTYSSQRNYDFGPAQRGNVSALSPWIRHRLVTEREVLAATLARHAPSSAEKFIQEVFWRAYFNGWLEHRPSIWTSYCTERDHHMRMLDKDGDLRARLTCAEAGETGIDGFDAWAQELVGTGYLHNHARMWFASIWIFTLKLPWQLGADFFLRHLLDGDPASNTLSWRWVAGLHTVGKNYAARTANIAKYTGERFRPTHQLESAPVPLDGPPHPQPVPPSGGDPLPNAPFVVLVTEDECAPLDLLSDTGHVAAVLGLTCTKDRSPRAVGDLADAFAAGAVADGCARVVAQTGVSHLTADQEDWTAALCHAAEQAGVGAIVTGYAPTGPVAQRLAQAKSALGERGLSLHQVQRDYDAQAWPHCTKGFFKLKQKIPQLLKALAL
ncbi:MAG: FAD-binding domain-containing protein [Pseudomonadota bacterium]